MPISYVLDRAQRQVRTTITGVVTVEDIINHVDASRRDQTFSYGELIDVRGVIPPFLSSTDIWRVASLVRAFKDEEKFGPRAVVVGSDLIFGTVRMFSNLVSDFSPISVFHDPADAEAWLTKPADPGKS